MDRATDRYAPGLLPTEFQIVHTPIPDKNKKMVVEYGIDSKNPVDPHVVDDSLVTVEPNSAGSDWKEDRKKVETVVQSRRRLYRIFADFSFIIVAVVIWLWRLSDDGITELSQAIDNTILGIIGHAAIPFHNGDILGYFSPKMFENFIEVAWVKHPIILILIALSFVVLFLTRGKLLKATVKRSVAIREKIEMARLTPVDINNKVEKIPLQNSEETDTR